MTHKLSQNVNFQNGGTTIQLGIMYDLLTFCQYVLNMVDQFVVQIK